MNVLSDRERELQLTDVLASVEAFADRNDIGVALWDFDGVIADSEPLHRETYRRMLVDLGYHPPDDFFAGLIGRNEGEIWRCLASTYGFKADAAVLRNQRMARFRNEAGTWLKPTWFVTPLLHLFRHRGIRQAIVSSGNIELLHELLRSWKIDEYFVRIYGWSPNGRTSVDKSRVLADLLRENERCLVIEDDAAYLRMARSFGARTIGIRHGLNQLKPSDADVLLSVGQPEGV
jgi:beta-phosphoglucomutase-like phosphatase (HAD superfamily)